MSSEMKMSENGKKKMLMRRPALRFPEFFGSKEWQEGSISDLFNLKKKSEKVSDFDKEKVITVKLHANGIVKNERNGTLTGGATYFIRHTGQFVFSKIDLLNGAFGLIPPELDKFCTSSDVPAFYFKQEESALFFINWLKANYRKIKIERTGTSNTLKRISIDKFLGMPIPLPDIQEQQKIADCLSSLDNVISLQTKKIDSLQRYKKGLMQKLFPAEGETVPELRFGEFKGTTEWKERKFGDVAMFYKGKGVSKSDIVRNGETPCIRYGELYTHYGEVINSIISNTNIPESDLILSIKNDVIIPSSGETKWDIATASCVMLDNVALGGDLNIIRTEENGIFISYYLNSVKKYEISKIAQGDTVVHLYSSQLKQLMLLLPPKREEQQKIADCLSSLDELIVTEAQKLSALKIQKTGLMQQLFPSMDEVNA